MTNLALARESLSSLHDEVAQGARKLTGVDGLQAWISEARDALDRGDLNHPALVRGRSPEAVESAFGYKHAHVGAYYLVPVLTAWIVLGVVEWAYERSDTEQSLFGWWASSGAFFGLGPSAFSILIGLSVALVFLRVLRVSNWNRQVDELRSRVSSRIHDLAAALSAVRDADGRAAMQAVLDEVREMRSPTVFPEDTAGLQRSLDRLAASLEKFPPLVHRLEKSLEPFPALAGTMTQSAAALESAVASHVALIHTLENSAEALAGIQGAATALEHAAAELSLGLSGATEAWSAASTALGEHATSIGLQQGRADEAIKGLRELHAGIAANFTRTLEMQREMREVLEKASLALDLADDLQPDQPAA